MKLPNLKPKTKNLKLKIVIALSMFYVLGFILTSVNAQELQRTYTVINPQIAVKLDPGTNSEGTTQVINETNVPLTFTLSIHDYIVTDTKGTPNFLPENNPNNKYSASAWIGVTPTTFTLKPQEKQVISYYIHVPITARPGGHYAGVVYAPINPTENGTGSTVKTQIGSLFYITVNGPVTEKAEVTKFFANGFQEYGPVKILTQIKNLGDLHIKPESKIKVSGLFNNNSYDLPQGNIFPETSRDFENTVGQWLMIGRYKAELLATYGTNNNLPLAASVYFWVFPWRLMLVIILIIVATILGYKYYKKRKKDASKATHEAKSEAAVNAETKDITTEDATKK